MTKTQMIAGSCLGLLVVIGATCGLRMRQVGAQQAPVYSSNVMVPYSSIFGAPTSLSQFANDTAYITAAAVPTKLSQLTNDAGFLNNSTAVLGTITVPATLLSLGTTITSVSNGTVVAGSFYLCAFNTTNSTAQASLDVQANAMSTGTLNVVLRNSSATTLAGGYTVAFKCIQQ